MQKKTFLRTDISIPEVEHVSSSAGAAIIPLDVIPPKVTDVVFQVGISETRTFSFGPLYGIGVNQIVYACQRQVERFVDKQDVDIEQLTVFSYCYALKKFLKNLSVVAATAEREFTLADIDRTAIDGYLTFLMAEGKSTQTQKTCYQAVKTVLSALGARGIVSIVKTGDMVTFPRNPFPSSHKNNNSAKPLSLRERKTFSAAIRNGIQPLFVEGAELTGDLVGWAMLAVALHTGRNTTPLLEASIDCLQPHPKEDRQFLVLYKRRGHSVQQVTLKAAPISQRDVDSMSAIRFSVAGLIQRVIALSEPWRTVAPEHLRNLLWLYRSAEKGPTSGSILVLTQRTLPVAIQRLVQRYRLVDSDGNPLRITVSRLRKTFVNRLYDLLEGDLAATAKAAGNTPRVTQVHYLRPGEDAEKNWKFMGKALVSELLTNTLGATERTPVGRCSDAKHGDFAPKRDGATCMSFLNCIRCRNYVVTGDDLYRLFSFYWRLLRERAHMRPKRWKSQFSHIVRLIERDVIEAGLRKRVFRADQVEEARKRARTSPHPFWSNDAVFGGLVDR